MIASQGTGDQVEEYTPKLNNFVKYITNDAAIEASKETLNKSDIIPDTMRIYLSPNHKTFKAVNYNIASWLDFCGFNFCVPTRLSQLENDMGFVVQSDLPKFDLGEIEDPTTNPHPTLDRI